MKERIMTTVERLRLTAIEENLAGEITNSVTAARLNLTVRQVQRLKKRFREKGHDALIHGARGRPGTRRIEVNLEDNIVKIIKDNYPDFGPLLVCEKLQSVHSINLSDETIRQIMIRNNVWVSRRRKRRQYFAWRERRSSYGELEQFDGSYHDWFEGRNVDIPEACLLTAIDDATGKITYAKFGYNESVEAVFNFWREYIVINGIPGEIYLDKFSTYKINHKEATDNQELMTQFTRAAKELGINLITAHTPQAKGRVERLFQTLQDRLIKEMRLAGINTINQANMFLTQTFIPWFNQRYAVVSKSDKDCHRKVDIATGKKLKSIFAKHYTRSINNDFTVQYKTKYYQLKEIQPITVFKTDRVLIEERLDNTIEIKYKNHYLNYYQLPEKPPKVKSSPVILTTHKLNWVPPKDHPWRRFAFG